MDVHAFSADRFLNDLQHACARLDVAYSEDVTRNILDVFQQSFVRGSVLWRTTDQPNGALNYRVYERQSVDMVSIARQSGLIEKESILGTLVQSWARLYGSEAHQLCDFDASRGLVKFWVYLGGIRPLDEILSVPGLPESIRRHKPVFEALGLSGLRHTAVDMEKSSVNFYFRTPAGRITRDDVNGYLGLARADPISDELFGQIERRFPAAGGTFSVTMDFATGEISRVAVYALRLSPDNMPVFNQRVETFLQVCPSYDEEEMIAIAWSFGVGEKRYIKVEHSHSGGLVSLLEGWRTTFA